MYAYGSFLVYLLICLVKWFLCRLLRIDARTLGFTSLSQISGKSLSYTSQKLAILQTSNGVYFFKPCPLATQRRTQTPLGT
ncbi:hypothetical protein TWF225_007311 [Orbilia oligospora]|nr:hypothetical protein TWF225_007311 [Orbilia oligospora]KAF3290606.1 hypothetical protein TWF132_006699 [Orbilia oligospora]